MESTRPRVYQPHLGEPATTDPLEVAIFEKTRSRLISTSVFYAFAIALIVLFRPGGLVVWTVVAVFGVLVVWAIWMLARRIRPLGGLLRMPSVVLTPGAGQLLVSSAQVSIALPGPEPRWVVARMPRSKRLLLARERRVFMLGPDSRGRLAVAVPGSIIGHFGRVRTEPAPGSAEPSGAEDPVVAFVREGWRRAALMMAVFGCSAAFMWVVAEAIAEAFGGSRPGWPAAVFCVAYALLGLARVAPAWTMAHAARSPAWTELGATLDTPIEPSPSGTGNTTGRVTLPGGATVRVRFGRQPLDLLVNVRDTGRLWVLGEPARGRKVVAGLPGYPVLGLVKLG